jgi:predicted lipid-binding transport protein (Tim44 family)
MKSKTGWIAALILALILILVLPGLFLTGRNWGGAYGGMMGGGMMGGYGYLSPFGFIGMRLMWLIPAGLLVLLALGAVSLFQSLIRPGISTATAPDRKCASCGKPVQPDWSTCPYCGTKL